MKPLYLSVFILVPYFTQVFAETSLLTLEWSIGDSVVAGQTVSYNCSSVGNGVDPTLEWSIRDLNSNNILNNSQLSSQIIDGAADTTDGAVKSRVTFVMQSSYFSAARLYCEAFDVGSNTTNPAGQVYYNIYTTTTTTAELDQSCSNTITCSPANSACISSVCACNDGFYDTNSNSAGGSCSPSLGLGSECPAGIDAACIAINSRCSQSFPYTCKCRSGYVQSGSICVLDSVPLGESCVNPPRSCYIDNSYCNGTLCVCSTAYYRSGTMCLSNPATINGTCVNPTRTCPDFSNCNTGTCQCNTGYIYSSTSSSCITSTAYYGEQCGDPARSCIGNTVCVGSICVCSTGYYYRASTQTCTLQAAVGAECSTSESDSCLDGQATCVGSTNPTCMCNVGYIVSGGSCIVDSATTSCPTGSSDSSTVLGEVLPSAPDVYVGQTCYTVDLQTTEVMECKDTKGTSALQSVRWLKLPSYEAIVPETGSFINGDLSNQNLTVSSAKSSYAGQYVCQLCYGSSFTRCTDSSPITLIVIGSAITSVSVSANPSATPAKDTQVTLTCTVKPLGGAYNYTWLYGNTQVSTVDTYTIVSVQTTFDGSYRCVATNSYGSMTSTAVTLDVQYAPEPSGGTLLTVPGNFANGDITITCNMAANPAVISYYFYDDQNNQLQNSGSNTYSVTSSNNYATYSCRAVNSIGQSEQQFIEVIEDTPSTGASTEDTGIGTGTIAAIVLGIIFLLLLIIIILVCCCSFGWCRKKEKIEPQIIEKPIARPYLPRNIVSAKSTVSRKDVGVMMNGYRNGFVSTGVEEPIYTTPRYHLKPAMNGGPIISIFDDGYDQPRAHQLPALDTQYLYTDNEPKKHKKKKRRHRHHHHHNDRDESQRQYEEVEEPVRYAETVHPNDDDLVVIPGNKQNYFE